MSTLDEPGRIVLVTGGAASGKSALAERLCCERPGRRVYIAAMEPHGPEAQGRIVRHRALRAGKGFETVERPRDLAGLRLPDGCAAALLEDLGNLAANEMFGGAAPAPVEQVVRCVLAGVTAAAGQAGLLVVVTNAVFSDAARFDPQMQAYLRALGEMNRQVAQRAAVVVESVCGLPYWVKGENAV